MSADEDWVQEDVPRRARRYGVVVSSLAEGVPAAKRMLEGPNLGLVILSIAKASGADGMLADEMQRAVLQLTRKLKLENGPSGSIGPRPERVQKLVAAFSSRGFFDDTAPARLTSQGELWLNSELKTRISDPVRLEEFWTAIGEATGRKKCPHCQTFNRFASNACNICQHCGQRSCDV